MSTPVLRPANISDAPALVELWARAGENRARPTDRDDLVVRLLERDPDAVILAEVDGRLVGTVVAVWDGWRAHLYRLAVDPDLRGQGIARRLLDAAEERLRALGAERIDAMVLDDNEAGRALWSAAGFAPQPDWSRWVKPVAGDPPRRGRRCDP
ncbi:N-acetyltransferase [Marmoricola endophyticus]|uniref:N-acetyltransferase n=1 Tax=Marmoricola endophyticus TaxID=2040280 RepID=A0A917BN92_9ACTN|nr:GNAT family N-acetyltransferase [Marmoricola endophyticus]GGF52763.1 N-acetyltransferase [Marmoricola endophyticus]